MILSYTDDGWRKRFALFPIFLSDGPIRQVIWLEWVWKRFAGLYTEVSLTDPRAAQGTEARRAETVKQGSVHDGPVTK